MFGSYLTLLIGPGAPLPAPPELLESLESVSVQQADRGRNGFQLTFSVGRGGWLGAVDYPPILTQLARPGNRVIILLTHNARPQVLMDGIVANLQLSPSPDPSQSKLTLTGHDLTVLMDLVELKIPLPCPTVQSAVNLVLGMFSAFMTPLVIPPTPDIPVISVEQTPTLDGSPYSFVTQKANDAGYVFHVRHTPVPAVNVAYFGPPIPDPILQPALTFRMGAATTLGSIQFTNDASGPSFVYGLVQQEGSPVPIPVSGIPMPPLLSSIPSYAGSLPFLHVKRLSDDSAGNVAQALGKATAQMFESNFGAVKASGELDVAQYGSVLRSREFVGVRGVGLTFDGLWYVKSVSHNITRGSHKQSFELQRDGTLSNLPFVMP